MYNLLKFFLVSTFLIIDMGVLIVFYLLVKYSAELNDDDYEDYKNHTP